jgi:hypothetical protein
MNVLSTTWRQLVRSRLWPVAVLLVAALAAVPFLLGRDAEPVAASPAPAGDAGTKVSASLAQPVVEEATPEERSRRRRVLGARKDPFRPEALKHPKKKKVVKAPKVSVVKTPKAPKSSSGGSSSPTPSHSGGSTIVPSVPTVPAVPVVPTKPKKTYAKGSLIVRFGDATTDSLPKFNLRKLAALPKNTTADETPLLVYTGLTKNRKKAIFLVDDSLNPAGDGTCQPHPSNCETVQLAKGETEFFDVVDPDTGTITAQFELDLVDIK